MSFKYNKLRGRIVEVYGSQDAFASAIGSTANTVSRKLNGIVGFSQEDICDYCDKLNIPLSEVGVYFFELKVQSN